MISSLVTVQSYCDEEQEFSDLIELKYPREYACARKIADYIEAQSISLLKKILLAKNFRCATNRS